MLALIIHENRFTYQDKGLKKIIDLGDYWEKRTGCAIPLGGIVANRNLPLDVQHKINRVLRKSVEFAFANPKSGLEFIRSACPGNERRSNVQTHRTLCKPILG
jgi:1,4-dihydroxy-6-naphthoate synthase